MTAQTLTYPASVLRVVKAHSPADVRDGVLTARDHHMPFAVRATGHGDHGSFEDGLLLDTSEMRSVEIDADRQIATVGPGAQWADVIAAAAPSGLAPVSGSSTTVGVTGFTVGGGVGWLARKHGFAADNVLRAEVVTADGELLVADHEQNADLFWAIRGGGGNFGVVTSLEFRLHRLDEAFGGVMYFPYERAAEVLEYYGDWVADRPEELTVNAVLMHSSPIADSAGIEGPVLGMRVFYAGGADAAERALRPLLDVAGVPLYDDVGTMTYAGSGTIGGTRPRSLHLLRDLSEPVIEHAITAVGNGEASAAEFRLWGGAMARDDVSLGPVGHRDVPFSITFDGPASAATGFAPYATGGSFLNWLHDVNRTRTAFTALNYRRLRRVKRTYDPENIFRWGHNIPPA